VPAARSCPQIPIGLQWWECVNANVNLPHWEGWRLIGSYESDVGSWLLHHHGEALLLEVPEGLIVQDVKDALNRLGTTLLYVTASHDHWDHIDQDVWRVLARDFPAAKFIHPSSVRGDRLLSIGGEPCWLVKAPKHSPTDVVTVFRGVAMTGDIELGMLASVNDEVPLRTKKKSMDWLRGFQDRAEYHVHSIVSAHLNDVRVSIRWPDLFRYEEAKRKFCRRCGGKLVPIERDAAGFDLKCADCGRTEWSDPRKL